MIPAMRFGALSSRVIESLSPGSDLPGRAAVSRRLRAGKHKGKEDGDRKETLDGVHLLILRFCSHSQ
jgi:hypothetical protein